MKTKQPLVKVVLHAQPMKWTEIPDAVSSIKEVLPLLRSPIPLTVAATASAIMQTAANIQLTANLRGLNDFAVNKQPKKPKGFPRVPK